MRSIRPGQAMSSRRRSSASYSGLMTRRLRLILPTRWRRARWKRRAARASRLARWSPPAGTRQPNRLVGFRRIRAVEQLAQRGEALVNHLLLAVARPLVPILAALWTEARAVLAAERAHWQRQNEILANRLAGIYLMAAVDRESQFRVVGWGDRRASDDIDSRVIFLAKREGNLSIELFQTARASHMD